MFPVMQPCKPFLQTCVALASNAQRKYTSTWLPLCCSCNVNFPPTCLQARACTQSCILWGYRLTAASRECSRLLFKAFNPYAGVTTALDHAALSAQAPACELGLNPSTRQSQHYHASRAVDAWPTRAIICGNRLCRWCVHGVHLLQIAE